MSTIHFISFADTKSEPMLKRIHANAKYTGWFESIETLSEKDFDRSYIRKYGKYFHMRGFGYWIWKSYIVKRRLSEINDGDVLLYADAGCTLNQLGAKRFREYICKLKDNDFGMLVFEQQGLIERQWTKGDLLKFTKNRGATAQFWAGAFMLRKTPTTIQFVDEYYDLCHNHFNLITDSPSVTPNAIDFIENRHDQSAFSCLAKRYSPVVVSADETFTKGDYSVELSDSPIWATRLREYTWYGLKKMSLKKRFPKLFGRLW